MGRPKKNGEPAAKPAARTAPDFSGVPGELVAIEGFTLVFGGGGRKSPYDALLNELAAAGAGKVLRFADPRARTSVAARARKLDMRVSFAESGGALFVRFDGSADDDVKAQRRERIKAALKVSGGSNKFQLAKLLADKGDATVDAHLVGAILTQLQRSGDVIQAEGEIWRLNPTKRG